MGTNENEWENEEVTRDVTAVAPQIPHRGRVVILVAV